MQQLLKGQTLQQQKTPYEDKLRITLPRKVAVKKSEYESETIGCVFDEGGMGTLKHISPEFYNGI